MGLREKDTDKYEGSLPFASEYFEKHPELKKKKGYGNWNVERVLFGSKGVSLFTHFFTIFIFKSSKDYLTIKKMVSTLAKEGELCCPLILQFPTFNTRYGWDFDIDITQESAGFWVEDKEGVVFKFISERLTREETEEEEKVGSSVDVILARARGEVAF